jgi:hypothetical protein
MNLPLHYGLLGALEAGLIALLVALLVYAGWAWLARRNGMSQGHVVGWSCLVATVIGAGYDIWNLVYICIVRLESPLYARLAFASIHDPDGLGTRVVLELAGVLAGVGLGWRLFSAESEKNDAEAA